MSIRVGNAPCSWGTLEFGSTQSDRIGWEQMLDEVVQSGYEGCELGDWGFMSTDLGRLTDAFAQRNLSMTGAYVGLDLGNKRFISDGVQTAVRTARLIGSVAERLGQEHSPFLVLAGENGVDPVRTLHAGRVEAGMMFSNDEWSAFAAGAEQVAQAVRSESGLRTLFHHHCAGYVETPEEIRILMERTDPALLGLVFDTGHFAFGAGHCDGILSGLERFASRIGYVHFKDFDPHVGRRTAEEGIGYFDAVRNGVFCELGKGCVDFPAVLEWLRKQNYAGFVTVEQDVLPGMGAPKESAARNRAYLREIGL